ncbi:MAG: tetratricopeptide repeat protein [Chitinophagales bacterium]|jgi:tetratricopeptide (TPR) repeat protein|nr:tetratricopeptide repeat protein [Sphingobacteriales bacterium]
MKQLCLFIGISLLSGLHSQTKDVSKAFSYYSAYMKESRLSDIDKAYEIISTAMKDPVNETNAEAHFYNAVIVKQYFESKKLEKIDDFIAQTSQSLIKSYQLDKNFKNKEQLLKLMQILGYDLYSEGIRQHRDNKHELAYQLYKYLFQIQSILAENKLDFTVVSSTGEKTTLSSKDMTNNMVVFCINSGKKEDAKALFEKEIQANPSALSYARLIQLCYQLEDKASANKYVQEGLAKYPKDSDLLVFSINSSLGEKNYQQALKQLDEAIRSAPSVSLFLVKSQTLENQDKYEEAIANYREALKLYPNDFDLNYGLGYVLLNTSFEILNEQNEKTKPKALVYVKEAKDYFNKAKSIDGNKVDFEKIFEQINKVK